MFAVNQTIDKSITQRLVNEYEDRLKQLKERY